MWRADFRLAYYLDQRSPAPVDIDERIDAVAEIEKVRIIPLSAFQPVIPQPAAEAIDHIGPGQEVIELRAVDIKTTGHELGIT